MVQPSHWRYHRRSARGKRIHGLADGASVDWALGHGFPDALAEHFAIIISGAFPALALSTILLIILRSLRLLGMAYLRQRLHRWAQWVGHRAGDDSGHAFCSECWSITGQQSAGRNRWLMPDWSKVVHDQLGRMALGVSERSESSKS